MQSDAGASCEWDIGTGLHFGEQNLNMCKVCADDRSCDAASYTDNGDGTVKSSCCGLVWQQVVDVAGGDGSGRGMGLYTLAGAKAYCAGLTLAGGGWRLPTIEELYSLVVLGQMPKQPVINRTVFPATPPDNTWSSSPVAASMLLPGAVDYVWIADFYDGTTTTQQPEALDNVRCVR
jgi:hypothetical protein